MCEKMPQRRIRAHYQQMPEFKIVRIIGLKKQIGQIEESRVIWVKAMQSVIRRCWQEWMDCG